MRCRGGKIVGEDDGEDEVGFKLGRRMIVHRGELEGRLTLRRVASWRRIDSCHSEAHKERDAVDEY
jgi:hypothetical protein